MTVADLPKPGPQTHATSSASLASGAISSVPANLTWACRYMLDTHEYQHLSPSIRETFPVNDQAPSPFATLVLMGEGS